VTTQRTPERGRLTRRPLRRRPQRRAAAAGPEASSRPAGPEASSRPAGPEERQVLDEAADARLEVSQAAEAGVTTTEPRHDPARADAVPAGTGRAAPVRLRVPVSVPSATILVLSAPGLLMRRTLARIRPAMIAALLVWAVAGVTLFVVYLHVARTSAVTSDGASNALQAWDILRGNVLLRGWQLSDVSFYPTELGQYALIEHFAGLKPDVVHLASAMTYTLLVLMAALLAKGRATGRDAIVRCLVAAGIMLAPQAGNGIYVLMGSPDHIGSTVPVLATFLLLDRARRRWYTVAAAGLLLSVGLVADGVVSYTGIAPVLAVCGVRIYLGKFRAGGRWRDSTFELALAAVTVLAIGLSRAALRMIASHGGFAIWPVRPTLATPEDLGRSFAATGRGLLLLFGANFLSHNAGFIAALAFAHLTGLGLAAWAASAAIRRIRGLDIASALLAAGVVMTLVAYVFSTRASGLLSARDITAVLPFSAALAGRMLAGRLRSARLVPALTVVLAGYLISLGQVVTLPPAPPQSAALGSWLATRHLVYGLAGYWNANVTTLDTGGKVALRPVLADGTQITTDYWEVRSEWFSTAASYANFIVLVPAPPGFNRYPTVASVRRTFGQPLHIYYVGTYTIMVWNKNLLADLVPGGPLPPRSNQGKPAVPPLPAPPGQ
jgi:hypothetical protein